MARTLWCRHKGCQFAFLCVAGAIPTICPSCKRESAWITLAPTADPIKPYELSHNDRRFLRSIRIQPDDTTSPDHTGRSEPA